MISLRLEPSDLQQIRFAFSPTWETVTSIRRLSASPVNGVHMPWLRQTRQRLGGLDVELLTDVVRPAGYIPDFLHPFPARRAPSFSSGLDEIARADPRLAAEQLVHLADHPVAMQAPDRAARVARLHELAADPSGAVRRLVDELDKYWRVAIAPHWARIRAVLEADLGFRLQELADGWVQQLFRTLHPSVSLHGDTVQIVKYYNGRADLHQRGLLLIPCAFAWPDVLVRTADPQPALTYTPRGLGRIWESSSIPSSSPLAGVLGQGCARVLAQMDLPMTGTQLACQLGLSAPTLNVHLRKLAAAVIVNSRRDGRAVLYYRTDVGERLLTAHGAP